MCVCVCVCVCIPPLGFDNIITALIAMCTSVSLEVRGRIKVGQGGGNVIKMRISHVFDSSRCFVERGSSIRDTTHTHMHTDMHIDIHARMHACMHACIPPLKYSERSSVFKLHYFYQGWADICYLCADTVGSPIAYIYFGLLVCCFTLHLQQTDPHARPYPTISGRHDGHVRLQSCRGRRGGELHPHLGARAGLYWAAVYSSP